MTTGDDGGVSSGPFPTSNMYWHLHHYVFSCFIDFLLSALACASSSNSSAAATSDEEAVFDCAALVKARRYAEAIPMCTTELRAQQEKENGSIGELSVLRATAYAAEGQAMKALSDFEAALKEATATNLDAAHLGRCQILLRQGRFNDARQDIKAVSKESLESKEIKNKIDEIEKRFDVAQKLFEGGHWEKANSAFERLQLDDHLDVSKLIYTMRAKCLTRLGRYMDAVRMYQGRSTLELESSETEYEVGRLYLALGNLDKGRKLIDDCARSNPDHRASLALRKRLKAITLTIDEADKMLIKQAVSSLEEALKQSSSVDPAEPYYDEALAPLMLSKPFELPILKLLCSKHIRLKQTDLALERCQRVLDLTSTSSTASGANRSKNEEESAFLSLGEAYVMAEKYEEAMNLLKQAQRAFPRSQRVNEALQKASADLRKSKQKDYYKIIGVPKDASESDIRRAYNKAARRWHPDKQRDDSSKAEAVAKMQDLNAALSILTDKKKRAQFDAGIDPEDPQGGAGHGPFHGGGGPFGGHGGPFGGHGGGGFNFNFEDLFRQQQQQQRRGHGGHRRQHQGGGQRFEDFFKFDL